MLAHGGWSLELPAAGPYWMPVRVMRNNSFSEVVIPNEVRDLHLAADCRSLTSFGMTNS